MSINCNACRWLYEVVYFYRLVLWLLVYRKSLRQIRCAFSEENRNFFCQFGRKWRRWALCYQLNYVPPKSFKCQLKCPHKPDGCSGSATRFFSFQEANIIASDAIFFKFHNGKSSFKTLKRLDSTGPYAWIPKFTKCHVDAVLSKAESFFSDRITGVRSVWALINLSQRLH